MDQLYLHEYRDPSSSGPIEQLSINNEGRHSLTNVPKLRSEVTGRKINREIVPL